ncbi:MAG TPA: GAF domain-containing sensor histidine kinase [Candidatus Dormibacteraeota bacterium]|nr:GAF domain-containing sensor histidine kinase [Candidatus Dormibacteraeota bacterium]
MEGDSARANPAETLDRWPPIARRIVWGVVVLDVLMVVLIAVSTPFFAQYSSQYGGGVANFLFPLSLVASAGFGALIALRRPRHPVGWLLLASSTAFLVDQGIIQDFVIYAIQVRHRTLPGGDLVGSFESMIWVLGVAPIAIFLPLVFPSGRLLSRRWRPIVWIAVAAAAATFVGNSLSPSSDASGYIRGVQPVSLPAPYSSIAAALGAAIVLLPVCVIAGITAMALRYKRGTADERHQIKWMLFAAGFYAFGFANSLLFGLVLGLNLPVLQDVGVLGLVLVPVAAAIAVLRYRLYDIDVVISRTLVYGALAAFITAVYVGIVVGVGTLVGSGGQPNLLLSIVATAIVAIAFQPVRERLQKIANRLVYGKRATPYEVLSQFSERVAETYAAEDALPNMARVLAEGTGSERAQVWLRAGMSLRPAATWPESGGSPEEPVPVHGDDLPYLPGEQAVPVRHQGELLGALTVTKRQGESLTPIEQKLLDDLAHQAGLVLKNVGLTAELLARLDDLRASRQRLVAAQDEERRRLERNLHDGAQQNLVAIKVKLGLAETLADRDPAKARELVGQLKADTDEALETLRDLARGIYPPLLADRGLAAALEAQARKATLPVEIDSDGVGRYPQDVEAAVYFCVLEALQNVQKYAAATGATVRLRVDDDSLTFEVTDDGSGFDPAEQKKGSGTQNMEDRLDALGGSVQVSSSVGGGTTVSGRLPIESAVAV